MVARITEDFIAKRNAANAAEGRPPVDFEASRRAFLRSTGLATAGAAALGLLGPVEKAAAQTANVDVQILNFALNLEYLEAEFYLHAAYGHGLADSDTTGQGTRGGVTGGSMVTFSDPVVEDLASELAYDEQAHVQFIRAVLGSAAVARPQIDFATAFTTAARAGNLVSSTGTFNPFADDNSFLLGSYIFEDVGVTAYHGAAPLVTNKQILAYAGAILSVEGYHAGAIRVLCFQKGLLNQTAQISQLRENLDGTNNDDQGVGPDQSTTLGAPRSAINVVPTDFTSRVFSRTPRQVLNIVYGASGASSGLFFPNGANPGPGSSILG